MQDYPIVPLALVTLASQYNAAKSPWQIAALHFRLETPQQLACHFADVTCLEITQNESSTRFHCPPEKPEPG